MRRFLAFAAMLSLCSLALAGNLTPLSFKDVSLMLRSGYSSDAVERELAARHFIGAIDAAAEKTLAQAGASPALINGLKAGTFAIPAGELAATQAELAAKEKRRIEQQEEAQKLNTLYQARLTQARTAPANAAPSASIASLVKGDLVTFRNGVQRPYLDAEIEKKKLVALYFSAHWCAPCRKFTPGLVAFYNKVAAAHPEFEIVFVSNDKSAGEMQNYMRDEQMPFPAVTYDKVAGNQGLKQYAGDGIPCLVLVDETGKVISNTYVGKNFRGPEAVLADIDALFSGKTPAQLAQAR